MRHGLKEEPLFFRRRFSMMEKTRMLV